MTDLRARPRPVARATARAQAVAAAQEPAPITVMAVVSGIGALLAGAVPIAGLATLAWLTSTWDGGPGSAGAAARIGLVIWLVAHHLPVTLAGSTLTLAPLGLSIALAALLVAAGRQLGRRCVLTGARDVAKASAALGIVYGAGLSAACWLVATPGSGVAAPYAPAVAFGVGFVAAAAAGAVGVCWQATQARRRLTTWVPRIVRGALVGGVAGAATMATLGLALLVVGLIAHRDHVAALLAVYDGGWFAQTLVVVLCVLLAPNAALFGVAYLLGPGFTLGTGTLVSPLVVDLGPMPNVPLLGALPAEGSPSQTMLAVFAAPVVAAVVAVVVAARWDARRGRDWRDDVAESAALRAALAGVWAGLLVTGLVAAAGGGLGDHRLAGLGAPLLPTLALSVAWFGLTGAVAGTVWWLVGYRRRRN